jgi:hypothetical protein
MKTDTKTLPELIKDLGIECKAKRIDAPANATEWQQKANAYRVTLKHQGRKMSLNFYQGTGIKEEPSASDVVYCLAGDYSISTSCTDFKCFVDCFGLTIDSHITYKFLKRQSKRFEAFIQDTNTIKQLAETEY